MLYACHAKPQCVPRRLSRMSAAGAAAAAEAPQSGHLSRLCPASTSSFTNQVTVLLCRCGTSYDVAIISPQFAGKTLIARHRLVSNRCNPGPERACFHEL